MFIVLLSTTEALIEYKYIVPVWFPLSDKLALTVKVSPLLPSTYKSASVALLEFDVKT
jgi:hypothetical protein